MDQKQVSLRKIDMESALSSCIDAINEFREEHFVPLIVCSRPEEYLSQQGRLTLPCAVIVQPLTDSQVKSYLTQAGRQMAVVRKILQTHPMLQKLMATPLMLNLVMLTYRGN